MANASASAVELVACNIYVTAAASHPSALLGLLRRAQDRCRQLRQRQDDFRRSDAARGRPTKEELAPVAVIHAYADIPYDRSSFHLAGTPERVSDVASGLILGALREIDSDLSSAEGRSNRPGENGRNRHPYVGLVDHVSVMPVTNLFDRNDSNGENESKCTRAAARAARRIGEQVTEANLANVFYYGMACPKKTPLATVRREKTRFFQSGGASYVKPAEQHQSKEPSGLEHTSTFLRNKALGAPGGDTTIGTPVNFVENFNIRLSTSVSLEKAKTLTQFLRGKNIGTKGYGVAGVEALTLPYERSPSNGGTVYEVACNLTNPREGGVGEVKAQLKRWIERQLAESHEQDGRNGANATNYDHFVEDAYSVGTTEEQCIMVLSGKRHGKGDAGALSRELFWEGYDKEVFHNFKNFLQNLSE